MGSASSSTVLSHPDTETDATFREDLGPIDRSLRVPVVSLIGWAVGWLLLGVVFSLVAAWKMHTPEFLGDVAFLTLGRLQPAAWNCLIYGWGFNAALAVGFWLLGRLSGSAVRANRLGFISILFWNVAVLIGVGGILIGDTTSLPNLEIPGYVTPLLFISFAILGSWLVTTLRDRSYETIFISQWYIVAGVFWFIWLFSAAQLMLVYFPVRGTVQSIVTAWYSHGLMSLWFGSVALAALYYFIPKISGRPIRHYYLANFGFWFFGAFNAWLGVQGLADGPVPAWVQAVGTAACLMSLVPVVFIGVNLHGTLLPHLGLIKGSPVMGFMTFSAVSFTLSALQLVATSVGAWSKAIQLTYAVQSQSHLAFFGFFTMAAFGAIYYMVPRLAQSPWVSPSLIRVHWAASGMAVAVIYIALLLGGIKQGTSLLNPETPFLAMVKETLPYLVTTTVGFGLFLIGQLAFAVNIVMTFAQASSAAQAPLVLAEPPQMEAAR